MLSPFLLPLLFFLVLWKAGNVLCVIKPTEMPAETLICEKDWVPFENFCYQARGHSGDKRLSWSDASVSCNELGGALASIHSKNESDVLANIVLRYTQSFTWIGFYEPKTKRTFEWSDGSTDDYVNWNKGEPSGLKHAEIDCVGLSYDIRSTYYHGKWNVAMCCEKHAYICKKSSTVHYAADGSYDLLICEKDWSLIKSYCYQARGENEDQRLSWSDASVSCKESGADLASILSADESDEIIDKVLRDTKTFTWIGFHDQETENTFKWTDGSAVGFVNWNRGEPSKRQFANEDCAGMKYEPFAPNIHGTWNDAVCCFEFPYICKKDRISRTLTTEETSQEKYTIGKHYTKEEKYTTQEKFTREKIYTKEEKYMSEKNYSKEEKYISQEKYTSSENRGGCDCASIKTLLIVIVICGVIFITVATFIYFKRNYLIEKAQNAREVIFKSEESCDTDENRSSDNIQLL